MSFSKLNFFFGDIMTKREQAMQNFKNGYNCAQAVLLAFSNELEIDEKRLLSYRRRSAAAWEECAKSAARSAVCLWLRGLNTVTPILRQNRKRRNFTRLSRILRQVSRKKRKHYLQGTSGRFGHFPHARTAHRRLL